MKITERTRPLALLAVLALPILQGAQAKQSCDSFKWDVRQEHRLFLDRPVQLSATEQVQSAPQIVANKLYQLDLLPQEQISFATPPSKKMLTDGSFAGQVRLRLAKAGSYRIAASAPFWIDISVDGKVLGSVDFSGSEGCDMPRKIVVYVLPAQRELVLQLGAAIQRSVRLSVTPAP